MGPDEVGLYKEAHSPRPEQEIRQAALRFRLSGESDHSKGDPET